MATMNPYVNFPGNTEEAFNFYKSVFGGEFSSLVRFSDMPQAAGGSIPDSEKNKLMHIALPIGKTTLMATDMLESLGQKQVMGNNFTIQLECDSKEEVDHIYNGLSAGGNIEMPIGDAMWGAYFGMFTDKYGIRWMTNYTYPRS